MINTPRKPIRLPTVTLVDGFSLMKMTAKRVVKMEEAVAMTEALIEGASFSPRKKKEMLAVIP